VVAGDPDRLQQVIWNLLSNAIKSCREVTELERIDSLAQIQVSDTGQYQRRTFFPCL